MKILFFADLHNCNYIPVEKTIEQYSNNIQLICCLGDINTLLMRYIVEASNTIPVIGVPGNHDSFKTIALANAQDIHVKSYTLGDLEIFGIGGSIKYTEKENPLFTQSEISQLAKNVPPTTNLLVTHNSPKNIHDRDDLSHEGFIGINNLLATSANIKYHIHGHQHINKISTLYNTTIIGVYGGMILDTETGFVDFVLSL